MASFDDHIIQAKRNIEFLFLTNKNSTLFYDWQTTICFYIGVHLINSHLAAKGGLHYRSHEQVSQALNPYTLSICSLPENIYVSYINLHWLSRRSRYLVSDKKEDRTETACFTSEKHFSKAIRNLDAIMSCINSGHNIELPVTNIICPRLISEKLTHFIASK